MYVCVYVYYVGSCNENVFLHESIDGVKIILKKFYLYDTQSIHTLYCGESTKVQKERWASVMCLKDKQN